MAIGYRQTELPTKRRSWVWAFRDMVVGEQMVADLEDRSVIANVLSRLHRETEARFTTKKVDKDLIIKRVL